MVKTLQLHASEIISIDCKTLRGSFDKGEDQKVMRSQRSLAIGYVIFERAIVTIDAMGCQKSIAAKIREKGADYVLALKDNHGDLQNDVRTYFEGLHSENLDTHNDIDKEHGRVEVRKCSVSFDIEWLMQKEEWQDLTCIVEIESTRVQGTEESLERRYYLSSMNGNPREIAHAIRSHWSIENSLHWVLDVTFNEDKSRIRKKNGPENMAIVRHTVLNLLRQNGDNKTSLVRRRRRALYRDDYLAGILKKI